MYLYWDRREMHSQLLREWEYDSVNKCYIPVNVSWLLRAQFNGENEVGVFGTNVSSERVDMWLQRCSGSNDSMVLKSIWIGTGKNLVIICFVVAQRSESVCQATVLWWHRQCLRGQGGMTAEKTKTKLNSVALVCEQTIPIEWPACQRN
jgi:hypothetical protein